MTFEVKRHLMKKMRLYNVILIESFDKIRFLTDKISNKKGIFKHKSDLM